MRDLFVMAPALLLMACGGGAAEAPASPEGAAAEGAAVEAAVEAAGTAEAATETPQGRVFFVEPQDGATLNAGPVRVVFGVEGKEVRPAGDMTELTGHHHLIINGPALDAGVVVPTDERHIHYGLGETETEVELLPGEYELTMQFADGLHQSFGPAWASTIRVTVEE